MKDFRVMGGWLLSLLLIPLGPVFSQNDDAPLVMDSLDGGAWTGQLPDAVLRPSRGEAPRYPRDLVIGDLGIGEADEGAYKYARELLTAIMNRNSAYPFRGSLDPADEAEISAMLSDISPRGIRIGGGRNEADGTTSFLFRFVGREMSVAGELYVVSADGVWEAEYIIAETVKNPSALDDADYFPYERFF